MSRESHENYYLSLARHSILEALEHLQNTESYLAKIGYVGDVKFVQRKSSGLLTEYKLLGKLLGEENETT